LVSPSAFFSLLSSFASLSAILRRPIEKQAKIQPNDNQAMVHN